MDWGYISYKVIRTKLTVVNIKVIYQMSQYAAGPRCCDDSQSRGVMYDYIVSTVVL